MRIGCLLATTPNLGARDLQIPTKRGNSDDMACPTPAVPDSVAELVAQVVSSKLPAEVHEVNPDTPLNEYK